MKKGIGIGIGIGILIIGIFVGTGMGSTPSSIPGMGGIPNSGDNQMSMSDSVQVTVSRGEPKDVSEYTDNASEHQTIEVNLEDGAGSSDRN